MAAELQSLLEKIQTEGVDKANAEAKSIIEQAEKKAAEKIAAAEKKCAEFQSKADADAEVLRTRTEQAIRQAARDVMIEVGQSIQETLERVLLKNLDSTLSGDFLQTFLDQIVKAIATQPNADGLEVLVAPKDADQLAAYAANKLATEVAGGLKISPNKDIRAGIRVMTAGGRIEHDFTDEAIIAAMSKMMSPALAQMIFDKK